MADEREHRLDLHDRTRDVILGNVKSSSENYDKALLTLSSFFLGGSLALINQVIDMKLAAAKALLYLAWGSFALTIVLTLASFAYTMLQTQPQLDAAERYYVHGDEAAATISTRIHQVVLRYMIACGVSFGTGILLLALFIGINVYREAMVTKTPKHVEHSIPPGGLQKPVAPVQPTQPAPQQPSPPTPPK